MEPWERLARLVEYTGISQAEIARRLGRDRQWVNITLWGKRGLTVEDIPAFAGALRMDVVDLARILLTDQAPTARTFHPIPVHQVPLDYLRDIRIGAFTEHVARAGEGLPEVTPEAATIAQVAELIKGLVQQVRQERNHV